MAKHFTTTPLGAAEAPVFPSPSLSVAAALALIAALERLIEAERDLGGYSGADPAVDSWFREAEAALEAVLHWTEVLERAPLRGLGDGRLRLVARATAGVMRCEDTGELAQRMELVGDRRSLLHMPGGSPSAASVNGLIDAVLDRVQACVRLAEGPGWLEAVDPDLTCDGWDIDPDEGPAAFI